MESRKGEAGEVFPQDPIEPAPIVVGPDPNTNIFHGANLRIRSAAVNGAGGNLFSGLDKGRRVSDVKLMSSIVSSRTVALVSFAENPILLSSLSSWFIAQLVKAVLVAMKSPRRTPQVVFSTLMWRTGGMPSSHSSLVAALATSVGLREGIGSNLFIVTLALALIVIRDSLGVRRSSGVQARSLNQLGKEVSERFGIPYHPVKEIQGHAPLEVLVGALLGTFIATAFALL